MNNENQTYETTTEKCWSNGWTTTSKIELEPCKDGYEEPATRVLEFTTSKGNRGISTNASVSIINNSDGCRSMVIFQDYSKTVMLFPKKRASEKSVKDCHTLASERFAEHLAAVKIQYKIGA